MCHSQRNYKNPNTHNIHVHMLETNYKNPKHPSFQGFVVCQLVTGAAAAAAEKSIKHHQQQLVRKLEKLENLRKTPHHRYTLNCKHLREKNQKWVFFMLKGKERKKERKKKSSEFRLGLSKSLLKKGAADLIGFGRDLLQVE